MGQLVNSAAKGSHWYRFTNGVITPCYEVPKKTGIGMKKTTLREAREMALLVSITTISNYTPKPYLQDWLIEQAIQSALTLPRIAGEGEDALAKRVVEDMDKQSEKAREFGTAIHDAIDLILTGQEQPNKELEPHLKSFREWAASNIEEVIACEQVVGRPDLGIAGRLDLHCKLRGAGESVVDFKTQKVKSGKSGKTPAFYGEWPRQLAAYARCVSPEKEIGGIVTVIIDSGEPGPVHVKAYDNQLRHWRMFKNCLELWMDDNEYDPSVPLPR